MRKAIEAGFAQAASPALALLGVGLIARALVASASGPGVSGSASRFEAVASAAAGIRQDLLLALCFALGAGILLAGVEGLGAPARRMAGLVTWSAYAAMSLWLALNVPAALLLGSPLTWPMLAGAGAALTDSVGDIMSWDQLLRIAVVLVAALMLPWGLRRRDLTTAVDGAPAGLPARTTLPRSAPRSIAASPTPAPRPHRAPAALGLLGLLALLGLLGAWRTPPEIGRHRNAVVALMATALRVGEARRSSPFAARADRPPLPDEGPAIDLRALKGRAKGRNLVWVVLESTGAAYLRPYGATLDPMPRLTGLARQGIVFEQAYAVYPESVKGLYSLLCARETRAYTAAADYAADRRPCVDLAGRLRSAGYQSALYHSGRFVYLGMRGIVAGRGYDRLLDAGDIGGPFESSFGVDEVSTVDRMLSDIDRRSPDQPFFIHYLPIAGHHPYESPGQGPRPFGERDNLSRYLSDLAMGDAALGRLIDGLETRGLGQDTLWVVSGDHGEAFEQHPGNVLHSLAIYEENVRVPLIIAAPGLTDSAGQTRRAPQIASLIDVAPSILDLLGIAAPDGWQGRSLLQPIAGTARFYTDHSTWQAGLRQGRWKYILDRDSGRGRLFDLAADPAERIDLAERFPGRAALYRSHLEGDGAALPGARDARP